MCKDYPSPSCHIVFSARNQSNIEIDSVFHATSGTDRTQNTSTKMLLLAAARGGKKKAKAGFSVSRASVPTRGGFPFYRVVKLLTVFAGYPSELRIL